jgi:hypothetical protein
VARLLRQSYRSLSRAITEEIEPTPVAQDARIAVEA